jgi:hypothetical protein
MLFAYRESNLRRHQIISYFIVESPGRPKMAAPVAFSLSVVAIVTMLFALQPWADNNG